MTETPSAAPRTPIPRDTIFVGIKPVMTYATAVMMSFAPGINELKLKARGNAISRAVDVAEVVDRRFFNGKLAKKVSIGTEVLGEGGEQRNVSTIEICLQRSEQ
ncbi:MAG: DNA/RNA-binding protein AlbA [archaeon]